MRNYQGGGVSRHNMPQQYNIRGRQIQEEKLLAEGGYGYIWRAYDMNTREVFALKRMICSGAEKINQAKLELRIMESLPQHPNIIRFYGGQIQQTQEGCIAIYLMELCDGGSLFDLISQNQQRTIPEKKLINIIYESAKGLRALHQMNPPIAHRDIKIENILLGSGAYKLCDFGSCSSQVIDFRNIPSNQYDDYEDSFSKTTTLMYRPPEMCEPSKQYLVNTKVDIWMLGCVLYTIAFYTHPFVESQKMAIIDANYRIPENSKFSEKFHDFIRHMLTPDPNYRPDINNIIQICENYDRMNQINLNVNIFLIKIYKQNKSKWQQI